MLLAHRDATTGEVDQEIVLEWDGESGWTIVLRVREHTGLFPGDEQVVEASAVLQPDDCRALATNLNQMADRFERER